MRPLMVAVMPMGLTLRRHIPRINFGYRRRPIMCRSLSLGLLIVALSALPADARGGGGGGHISFGARSHSARHFHHFNNFNTFNRFSSFNEGLGFNFSRFGRSRFRGTSGSGWGWGDWDNGGDWPTVEGAPGPMTVLAAPPALLQPPPPPPRATVETEAGVTVVRGPGSHQLARY